MPPALLTRHPAPPEAAGWSTALDRVLAEPWRVRVHYQPVVDLRRAEISGYEALARFPDAPDVPAQEWFAAAARLGRGGALEAQVVQAALVSRPLLRGRRFMSVNVSPAALLSAKVMAVLAGDAPLDGIVVELVDTDDGADPQAVRGALDALRRRGAAIAVDGLGGGASNLEQLAAIAPDFVKADGAARGRPDHGEPLLEALTVMARELGASLVVTGIETLEQLDAAVRHGVALGQGYALAWPVPALAELSRDVVSHLRSRMPADVGAPTLGGLVHCVPAVAGPPRAIDAAFASHAGLEHVLCMDGLGRPAAVVDRLTHARGGAPRAALQLPASTGSAEAARRAVARPLESRFDPVVCVDPRGAAVGIVPIDRLLGALAR